MLDWVGSWWSAGSFTGPARNAPNDGINIKKLFDQRPKQVISLTEAEVKQELKKLRPTKINAVPPLSHKPPIMQEFEDVFANGYKNYFESRKKRLTKANTETTLDVSAEHEISTPIDVSPSTYHDDSIQETLVSSLAEDHDDSGSDSLCSPLTDDDFDSDSLCSSLTDDASDSDSSDYIMSKEEIMAELAEFSSV